MWRLVVYLGDNVVNEKTSPQMSERLLFRDHISLVAILFGVAVWSLGSAIALEFEEHLAASSMLLIGAVLMPLSIWTTLRAVDCLRKRWGFPTLRESLVDEAASRKRQNDYANPVAASEHPFRKPVNGNSGSAFCYAIA